MHIVLLRVGKKKAIKFVHFTQEKQNEKPKIENSKMKNVFFMHIFVKIEIEINYSCTFRAVKKVINM